MKKIIYLLCTICLILTGCSLNQTTTDNQFQFAVISDTHVQDVEGTFASTNFSGASSDNTNYTIRPMYEQMMSTRLFNENYFAFYQVLNDLVDQGIKTVVFTGDISDDGQQMNIKKISEILEEYRTKYDMKFYIVPGNHEPPSPNSINEGDNFLTSDGQAINVDASSSEDCSSKDPSIACDDQMLSTSQPQMVDMLSNFGYMPSADDLLWASPYSTYSLEQYDYQTAIDDSAIDNRKYQTCNDENNCKDAYDLSYVVEPVDGYLFLCLDGDVYYPSSEGGYDMMGDNGLNGFAQYKPQTLKFVKDVVSYAKENDLQLVMFDHYPLADFYAGATDELKSVFGNDGLNFNRLATEQTASTFTDLGINLMFSGHMHYNATGQYTEGDNTLTNVMTSSTAAYVPSYKIVTTNGDGKYDINTEVIKDVANFDTLFPLYESEYKYEQSLSQQERDDLGITDWNHDILKAENYYDFNRIFLETLVQTRHYPEWSDDLKLVFDNLNLYQIVLYCQYDTKLDPKQFSTLDNDQRLTVITASFDTYLEDKGIDKQNLINISGIDIVTAFYKFLSARELAYADFTQEQILAFSAAYSYLISNPTPTANERYTANVISLLDAIYRLGNDLPANDFTVDTTTGTITDNSPISTRIQIL